MGAFGQKRGGSNLMGDHERAAERAAIRYFKPKPGGDAVVEGRVHFLYRREEHDGWGFAKVQQSTNLGPILVTVTGILPDEIAEGGAARVTGQWTKHSRFGWQVKIRTCVIPLETTPFAVTTWFEARFPGLGPIRSRALATHFGDELWDVVENHPERLTEVEGIGDKIAEDIVRTYHAYKAEREVYEYLGGLGLGAQAIKKAIDLWGVRAAECVQANPYILMDLPRTGFKTADRIARRAGLSVTDPRRLSAGFSYAAELLERDGHTCFSEQKLVATASKREVLNVNFQTAKKHFGQAVEDGGIIGEFGAFFRRQTADREHLIAERIAGLLNPGGQ